MPCTQRQVARQTMEGRAPSAATGALGWEAHAQRARGWGGGGLTRAPASTSSPRRPPATISARMLSRLRLLGVSCSPAALPPAGGCRARLPPSPGWAAAAVGTYSTAHAGAATLSGRPCLCDLHRSAAPPRCVPWRAARPAVQWRCTPAPAPPPPAPPRPRACRVGGFPTHLLKPCELRHLAAGAPARLRCWVHARRLVLGLTGGRRALLLLLPPERRLAQGALDGRRRPGLWLVLRVGVQLVATRRPSACAALAAAAGRET
jgi:hypothetical protein